MTAGLGPRDPQRGSKTESDAMGESHVPSNSSADLPPYIVVFLSRVNRRLTDEQSWKNIWLNPIRVKSLRLSPTAAECTADRLEMTSTDLKKLTIFSRNWWKAARQWMSHSTVMWCKLFGCGLIFRQEEGPQVRRRFYWTVSWSQAISRL